MNLKALITDDDAVSPVIGVILMVAITVILAAVIGTFVLGIGQNQQDTPSVTWDFSYDSSTSPPTMTIVHDGGTTLTSDNSNQIRVSSTGSTFTTATLTGFPYSAGDQLTSGQVDSGATVRIIWEAPGGGRTATIGESTVP